VAIDDGVITTRELRPYLEECGYRAPLLQEDYAYVDASGPHQVPLAAFAHQTYDARSACLAGVDAGLLTRQSFEELVTSYRGLGAPVLFACCREELQWWSFTTQRPTLEDKVSADKVAKFFHEHRKEFSPESIYRAKTLGRLDPQYQLNFVDVGLMPLFEHEMGNHLSKLIKRMCGALHNELGKPNINEGLGRWLFQSVFRLLAAKILTDKKVSEFSDLNLDDVSGTLRKVHNHYSSELPLEKVTQRQETGLKAAAKLLKEFGSLRNLTIESLAYVYENTLITKDIRKALRIHATPSYLVDYIVWQLVSWIEEIPQENRVVLEPTCGHAPFLISAARLLRDMIDESDPKKRHDYLKNHLLGVEVDDFAREIARLSLTLADVPNPNGWQLVPADVYKGQVLSDAARKATILLCNPPFQDFTTEEQARYRDEGVKFHYFNKTTEVLARTLPYMPTDSVFGVILPQGFLHASSFAPLRQLIVKQFELSEICTLPENVFHTARHKSAVILGRKVVDTNKVYFSKKRTRFKRIQKWNLNEFEDRYYAPTAKVLQSMFDAPPKYDFRLQMLQNVWEHCHHFPCLEIVADVGQGLSYKGRDLPKAAITISAHKLPGFVQGYTKFPEGINLTEKPTPLWMNLDPKVISRPRWGTKTGTAQILLNYARVSYGPWRLKALIERKGRPVTSSFLVVRPREKEWSLEILWAILNSPFANAYAFCHSLERANLAGMIRSLPLPDCDFKSLKYLEGMVQGYFDLYTPLNKGLRKDTDKECRRRILAIDAEVMRLYDLPPRLEREVLDLFYGYQRRGVDFRFTEYFPAAFESYIPLHEYLSEEYQRSTVAFVNKWVDEVRSPQIIKALEKATKAFKED